MKYKVTIEVLTSKGEGNYDSWARVYEQQFDELDTGAVIKAANDFA